MDAPISFPYMQDAKKDLESAADPELASMSASARAVYRDQVKRATIFGCALPQWSKHLAYMICILLILACAFLILVVCYLHRIICQTMRWSLSSLPFFILSLVSLCFFMFFVFMFFDLYSFVLNSILIVVFPVMEQKY
jgi:hypothetical protein